VPHHLPTRQQLFNQFSPTEYSIKTTVIKATHSIFAPRRVRVRMDALFTVMNRSRC
jgi:hypothetical protein